MTGQPAFLQETHVYRVLSVGWGGRDHGVPSVFVILCVTFPWFP